MSWDVSIQRFSRRYSSVEEIPEDETCLPLGTRAEVQSTISSSFTGTDWTDPTWGIYDSPVSSIEFNMGNEDPNTGFMLHVRASEAVVPIIVNLCISNHWQAIDCSSGGFLEQSSDPASGLNAWAEYRDSIVGKA
ncbi:hypothetical protein QYY77_17505 [Xanthomonas campestris pv. campestris]|uniref:hypothetical protein n=1 Tax=Xanthomonas campestris TaxID=339 RepID=UPI002AD48387|nr:hypothetical protein [Xanthomonas campestris]MEA0737843.1 hypothetical protein [Xanthomonas campestris pv. campestris]